TLAAQFNAFVNARPTGIATLQISSDFGATWGAPVWTVTGNGGSQAMDNVNLTLPDALAGTSIRLRFRFHDPDTSDIYITSDGLAAGLAFDHVVLAIGANSDFTTNFNPPTGACSARTATFDFTDAGGWRGGQFFGLANGDSEAPPSGLGGFGAFRWTDCDASTDPTGTYAAVVTASSGALSGTALSIGADDTGSLCGDNLNDYGALASYNVVSPRIAIPTPCAGGTVNLVFNAFLRTARESSGFDPATVRCYVQANEGPLWDTAVWTATGSASAQTFTNQTVDVTTQAGMGGFLRIRFEFVSTSPSDTIGPAGEAFGFFVDNVRLQSSNANQAYVLF
ncbi:MAG: hypothetical protein ABI743_01435, partial [bacterium]